MNEFTKNLLKTSSVLMIIAGGAALLVGATNALTAPVIEQNNIIKEKTMLSKVYGETADYLEWKSDSTDEEIKVDGVYLESLSLKYVTKVWTARNGSEDLGYVARFYGKNGYGDVDMLVQVSLEGSLGNLFIIFDTMSYKAKLESGYIDPYNASEKDGKEAALNDVKCGATFAAKLVRNGVQEALKVCTKTLSSTALVSLDVSLSNHEEQTMTYTFAEGR
jgi:Na+-translocating ferredoxin:NAD+ oxidoreductase RnfG subunit